VRYELLGPVLAWRDGEPVQVGGRVQRSVLAVLLLSANRVVSGERLYRLVWGERQPATVRAQLHAAVSGLRKGLGADRIVHQSDGYLIRVEPGQLDLDEFEAAMAAGRPERALALWKGDPLGGVSDELAAAERPALEERWLSAFEAHTEMLLDAGRHQEQLVELRRLVDRYPLREQLRGQLMRCLHRSGRTAEALAAFDDCRRQLAAELGIEPGPGLSALHQQILRDTPAPARPSSPVPAQLPAGVADFTGRTAEVARLSGLLAGPDRPGNAVPVVVVAGPGGVGKTALAVHTAHLLAGRFDGGQLHVDLHGGGSAPAAPAEVLERLLVAIGVPAHAVPACLEERADLYRSHLAGRRVLVLLDDAAGEAQVRPLLPGSARCAVVVTSRSRLSSLEGAHRLDLDVLDTGPAVALLGGIAGRERVGAEPAAAADIVALCDRLPLAVRIAGARLAARPHGSLADLRDRLRDPRRRLDELAVGDLRVRASIELSYRSLPAPARCALRLLAVLAVPDFPAWAVAVLLDTGQAEAEDLIDTLLEAGLVTAVGTRYRIRDLVRLYAHERAMAEDSAQTWHAALSRMLGMWLHRAGPTGRSVPRLGGDPAARPVDPALEHALHTDPVDWLDAIRHAFVTR
jgi:DNA-binding SARP family transcriptional activator